MKRYLALFCAALTLLSAQQYNKLDIIPDANGRGTGRVRLLDKEGKKYSGFAAPETVDPNGEVLYRLPAHPGGDGQVLSTNGVKDAQGFQKLQWAPNGGSTNIAISDTNPMILYAHFRDDDKKHLYFSYSIGDGVRFRTVKKDGSLATPENRDPTLIYYGGAFLILTSPTPEDPAKIPFYSSTDLRNFDGPYYFDMSTVLAGCNAAWAPEWAIRPSDGQLGFHVSLSTTGGPPFQATFVEVDPAAHTIGAHTAITITAPGAQGNFFDFFYVHDADTDTHYLFYVDEAITVGVGFWQQIAYATSSSFEGPYTQQTTPTSQSGGDDLGFSKTSEAPSILKMPNGCWRVYADTFQFLFDSTQNNPRKYTVQYQDSCSATPFDTFGGSGATATSTIDGNGRVTGINVTDPGSGYTSAPYLSFFGGGTPVDPAKGRVYIKDGTVVSGYVTATGWGYSSAPSVSIASGPRPIHIGASEHGTFIAITDPAVANVVFNAEAEAKTANGEMGRVVLGDTSDVGYYTLTLRSTGAHDWLMYNEAPTLAAEGPDGQAATLSGCGLDQYSCPPPVAGAGRWLSAYSGQGGTQIQMNNVATDTGETSILMGNGIAAYGNIPITGSSVGNKALWTFGTNNQWFGPEPDGGNVANNKFFIYNRGLGPVFGGASVSVPNGDFESSGVWTDSTCSVATSQISSPVHGGSYARSLNSANACAIYQDISGLEPGHAYTVSAWVRASADYLGEGVYLRIHDGTQNNATNGPAVIPPRDGWQKLTLTYMANSTGAIRIVVRRPGVNPENGSIYVDDVTLDSGTAIGAFAVGVSPKDGSLYANYGITLGEGDATALTGAYRVNIEAFGPGFLRIGNAPGDATAYVQTGTVQTRDYLWASGPKNNKLILNSTTVNSGEASLVLANGITQPTLGDTPTSVATGGQNAIWKIGTNNAYYGPVAGGGNSGNNWLFTYNEGLVGFPFGISPTTGEVNVAYSLSFGNGASTALKHTKSIELSSPLTNTLNIGDGLTPNSHNGIVTAGIFDAGAVFRLNGTDVANINGGGVPVWIGGVSSNYGIGATGAYYINGTIGVGGALTCNTGTIFYKDWAGNNAATSVCLSITGNNFSGGIRVF